jgi:hypothetical protein
LYRRRWNGLKKVGLLALALVLALGSLGVAYAVWTDQVYVTGVVHTGTLDIDICGVSSTFVYKVPGLGETDYGQDIQVDYFYEDTAPYHPPDGGMLVAQATTEDTSIWQDPLPPHEILDIDSATMTFEGVFPGIDFMTDLELEYLGSVPAKVSIAEIAPLDSESAEALDSLMTLGEESGHTEGIWLDAELSTDDGGTFVDITNLDEDLLRGLQLEQNDLLHVSMHVLLPEDPQYEHLTLNFSVLFTIVQWNEYVEPD